MKNRDDALLRRIIEYCSETEEAIKFFGGEDVFRIPKRESSVIQLPR